MVLSTYSSNLSASLPAEMKMDRRRFLGASAVGVLCAGAWPSLAAAAGKRGGTVVMTIIPEPPSMVSAFNTAAPLTVISPKMIEGLLSYDYDVNPRPQLARSWSVAPDGKSIEFKLQPNVKWHDGQPFTSADVAFSFMELLKKFHPRGRNVLAALSAVETPDSTTAIFRLARPSPAIMSALSSSESPILPKHIYEGSDPLTNPRNNNPIGTGPYKFVEWKRGNFIALERNPDYWDAGKPYLDKVIVRTFSDANARAAAFEAGELQLGGTTPVPLSEVERFRKNPNFTVEERGDELNNSMDFLEFNLRKPILGKVEVRQALRHAINRTAMIKAVWYGLAIPLDSPVPPVLKKFHASGLPQYPFDLKLANDMLDKAGYPRAAGNMRFKVTLDLPTISDVYQREAEFIRQSFRQVGVDVEIRISDVPSFVRRVYGEYDFDISLFPGSATADPTIGLQRFYYSKAAVKGSPFVNASGYNNPEMDQVLEEAAVEPDAEKRRALFARFQQIAMRDLPLFPLALPLNITIASAKLHDFMSGAEGIRDPLANAWLDP